jgi:L-lactate dehydrogenase complex protein LldF
MASSLFRERIRRAISDGDLQAALDANAEKRVKGREAAFASLPDWPSRRQRAHAVRADIVAHLDRYLADFCAKVLENGIHVHRAADAAEAIELVLEIGTARGAKRVLMSVHAGKTTGPERKALFAKSKSMVSEEIELNRALESHGHRVVETDLGEYIVQLRGEKPAHIITPAVHLRRHQVGELFHEQLGMPYTDDIPRLTAAARKVLRDVFLTADVGISGVNFGVVETGTVCIVTNEGNGRMVTTMPPVHIALMGMERLVPTLDDLALMLSLLPRSATGQKLSVYTQLIHSPRRAGEIDGAAERHLIILDNGRSRLRASGLSEALYCIRCGACLNACPVFREIGGHAYVGVHGEPAPYPGPIGSVVSPGLLGVQEFGQLAQASSLCGACKDACPVDIDLPRLLTRVRAGPTTGSPGSDGSALSAMSRIGLQAYGFIGAAPWLLAVSQRLAAVGASLLSPASEWMRFPKFTGWGLSKDFPRPNREPFRARWKRQGHTQPLERSLTGSSSEESRRDAEATKAGTTENSGAQGVVPDGLISRFASELEAAGGMAQRVRIGSLPAEIVAFLRKRAAETIVAWDNLEPATRDAIEAGGIRVLRGPDPTVRVGLTGCACAIAETGTLVLPAGDSQPLTTSLLPEVHVAIVHASQIVKTLEEGLRIPNVRRSSATVLVTGPSRTADIEMTLTIGVHGPKELIVYILE